jgi:hypothetical protein
MGEFTRVISQLESDDRVKPQRFQEIVARLLSESIIVAGDSQVESELYEIAVLLHPELADWFAVAGLSLVHNQAHRYFRLYPPAATSPGAKDSGGIHREGAGLFRRNVNANTAAYLIAFRILFEQGLLGQGRLQNGEVLTDMAEVNITLKNRLGREVAYSGQRKAALMELAREWRVIRYDPDVSSDGPAPISIRPLVSDILSFEAAEAFVSRIRASRGAADGGDAEDNLEEAAS